MAPIRVLLADDHTVVRQGLVSLVEASGECEVVAQAADGLAAIAAAHRTQPQVAVLDLAMPRLDGLAAARRIHAELPGVRLLVLTVHDEPEYVLPVVRAGAAGYLLKDACAAELLAAIRALASGQPYFGPQASHVLAEQVRAPGGIGDPHGPLSDRERDVFALFVRGHGAKQVAAALGISVKTADNHRSRILKKLGLHKTAELVLHAARHGLLGLG